MKEMKVRDDIPVRLHQHLHCGGVSTSASGAVA